MGVAKMADSATLNCLGQKMKPIMGSKGILASGLSEFMAMLLFVMIGVGTAMAPGRSIFQIGFAFGMGIVVLAYTIGNKSGGHINCAVTTALMVAGKCEIIEGLVIIMFQIFGSICGAMLLAAMIPAGMDVTGGTGRFGTNAVATGFSSGNAFCGEFMMTFLLLFVVFHTAVHNLHSMKVTNAAAIAIGMSVFCAHSVLIPITGCSINPTRTIGPLIVGSVRGLGSGCNGVEDLWIFIVAPELAGVVCGLL